MNKEKFLKYLFFAFLLGIAIISMLWLGRLLYSPESEMTLEGPSKQLEPTPTPDISTAEVRKEKEEESINQEGPSKKPSPSPDKDKVPKEVMAELMALEAEIKKNDEACQEFVDKALPDYEHVDPKHLTYKDPKRFIKGLEEIMKKGFDRKAHRYFKKLEQYLEAEVPFNPKFLRQKLEQINDCRPDKAVLLLETSLEAARIHRWPAVIRRALLLNMFYRDSRAFKRKYTSEENLFILGLLLKATAQGILPQSMQEQINYLTQRVLEERRSTFDVLASGASAREKRGQLLYHFRIMGEIGEEVDILLKDLETSVIRPPQSRKEN